MAKIARSVVDVMLGEAVSGTPEERFQDLLGIASVIDNRAKLTRTTHKDIISGKRGRHKQFDAYGKALPAGVEKYRSLAEKALKQVEETGPVHAGTYYATPEKFGKLSRDLKLEVVAQTAGHTFGMDPHYRPFVTARGTRTVKRSAVAELMKAVATSGVDAVNAVQEVVGLDNLAQHASKPKGLEALAPNGLSFAHAGQEAISPELVEILAGTQLEFGKQFEVLSGYRDPAYNRSVGGARKSRHIKGLAADISMKGLSPSQRQSLVTNLTQRGVGGFITYDNYPDMLHVDLRPRGPTNRPQFMHNRTAKQMSRAPDWFKEVAAAGGIMMPDTAPTPTVRPDTPAETLVSEVAQPVASTSETVAPISPEVQGAIRSEMTEQISPSLADLISPIGSTYAEALPSEQAEKISETVLGEEVKPSSIRTAASAQGVAGAKATAAAKAVSGFNRDVVRDFYDAETARHAAVETAQPVSTTEVATPVGPGEMLDPLRSGLVASEPLGPIQSALTPETISPLSSVEIQSPLSPETVSPLSETIAAEDVPQAGVSPKLANPAQNPNQALLSTPVAAPPLGQPKEVKTHKIFDINEMLKAQEPAKPRGLTASDIYGGVVGQALDNTGKNIVSRDPYGNTAVTNKWGVTTVTNAAGRQVASHQNGPLSAKPISVGLFDNFGKNVGKNLPSGREVLGTLIGSAVGSLLGPGGAVAGGALGRRAAMEDGPLGRLFAGSFPAPPEYGPNSSKASNRPEREMRDISPRAAEAIGRGKGGLY